MNTNINIWNVSVYKMNFYIIFYNLYVRRMKFQKKMYKNESNYDILVNYFGG